jgi:hypothetical protein
MCLPANVFQLLSQLKIDDITDRWTIERNLGNMVAFLKNY